MGLKIKSQRHHDGPGVLIFGVGLEPKPRESQAARSGFGTASLIGGAPSPITRGHQHDAGLEKSGLVGEGATPTPIASRDSSPERRCKYSRAYIDLAYSYTYAAPSCSLAPKPPLRLLLPYFLFPSLWRAEVGYRHEFPIRPPSGCIVAADAFPLRPAFTNNPPPVVNSEWASRVGSLRAVTLTASIAVAA